MVLVAVFRKLEATSSKVLSPSPEAWDREGKYLVVFHSYNVL